ncbi:DUF6968 family protein [Polyangium aurulentum]|uniref:DUF6968 family protein n=1 Tax=Polyangium aurulentum TaxID=2567896 RepID=UPI0010ADF1F6|nr:hypothetical protein [Polyangium aurulentum]UQA56731.1 hypothetical protein E8A73_036330 [Polyangium aurulentum]
MDVLATRVLQYRSESGAETDVTLTVFAPFKTERDDWKCGFQFSPPPNQRVNHIAGVDYIQAVLCCLEVARGYIEHPKEQRSSWQGMSHSGLPRHAEKPASYQPPAIPPPEASPGNLEVLTTRRLGCPNEGGVEQELILTVYKPLEAEGGTWKCGFSFGPTESAAIRYGVGADFIEALLDALALARVTFEAMVPTGWVASESDALRDCADFPYKIGRSFGMDRVGDLGPGAPEFLKQPWGS